MSGVSPMVMAGIVVWCAVTLIFFVLMGYRSLLSMREDDQLFLNQAESAVQTEQQLVIRRVERITPYAKGFGFASLGLLLLVSGVWIVQEMKASGMF